jgi:hypothetical protein
VESESRPLDTIRAMSAFTGGSSVAAMLNSRAVLNPWNEKNAGLTSALSCMVEPSFEFAKRLSNIEPQEARNCQLAVLGPSDLQNRTKRLCKSCHYKGQLCARVLRAGGNCIGRSRARVSQTDAGARARKTAPFAPKLCQKSLVLIPPISQSRQSSAWPTGGGEESDVALDETGAEG